MTQRDVPDLFATDRCYGTVRRRAQQGVMVEVIASPIGDTIYYPVSIDADAGSLIERDALLDAVLASMRALSPSGASIEVRELLPKRSPPKFGGVLVYADGTAHGSEHAGLNYEVVTRVTNQEGAQ